MDWLSVFLFLFSLVVLVVALANAVYFWKAYSIPVTALSTGTSLTFFVVNILLALLSLAGLVWSLYIIFTSPKVTNTFVSSSPPASKIPSPSPGARSKISGCAPSAPALASFPEWLPPAGPNSSVIITRA